MYHITKDIQIIIKIQVKCYNIKYENVESCLQMSCSIRYFLFLLEWGPRV
jgi:hypothetical protein